ncbi:MAG: hypothetical protein O7E54_08615 [Planctomycetota bacterium]|nr:hypothetical protein [Planctomycetota bacterium]
MLAGLILILLAPRPTLPETEAKAEKELEAGNPGKALVLYEAAIRLARDNYTKLRLRDAYRGAGWAEPRPVSPREHLVLQAHIRNEKARVWRGAADNFARQKKVHAAILTRRAIIELYGKESGQAKGERGRIKGLIARLTRKPTDDEKRLADRVIRSARNGKALLKQARKLASRKKYPVVVRVCQEILFGDFDQEIQNEARALRTDVEQASAADVPIPERKVVDDLMADERFERLEVARSRHFLFLGPKKLVQTIPERDRTQLDLAYIFQSDLASQHLTIDGARIVVYYQETFDFGGGLATTPGKLIRIGNRAMGAPVAGFLHYHELGHCVLGKGWLHPGFTEGLADFAAGFTLDSLGQTDAARKFITGARNQFVSYYLGRDVRYYEIQPYRPSAGFLFSLLPPGDAPYDWQPYRRVFHRMREAQFGEWPVREHQLMRYFGYLLSTEYGPQIFDKLRSWGFPVTRDDHKTVPEETAERVNPVRRGEFLLRRDELVQARTLLEGALEKHPDSSRAARIRYALMRIAILEQKTEEARALDKTLGIVRDYQVLGAFKAHGRMADVVFPPETEPTSLEEPVGTHRWKRARVTRTGYVNLIEQKFGYPEKSCAFAVTYVRGDKARDARLWLGSDDGHLLQVNGRLIDKRRGSHRFRFDDHFYDIVLQKGWNRILLKVHNGNGAWGFLMRLTGRDGKPLSGVEISAEDHDAAVPRFDAGKQQTVPVVTDTFKTMNRVRWRKGVGNFDTQNGRLRPLDTARRGLWNRFVVDPDKPASGPANILWLNHPTLPTLDSFDLEVVVPAVPGTTNLPAKFGITVDGEPSNDGQSGHTFVISPAGKKLACHWYRYDRLLYLQAGAEVPAAESYRVSLRRVGRKWWLWVNGVPLFERVDAERLPAFAVGLMTWGAGPSFDSFKLASRTRVG